MSRRDPTPPPASADAVDDFAISIDLDLPPGLSDAPEPMAAPAHLPIELSLPEFAAPPATAPATPAQRAPSRTRRRLLLAGGFLLMIGALLLTGRLVLAPWLLSSAQATLSARLGSAVTIRAASLLLPNSIVLDGVESARGRADRLTVTFNPWRLLRGERRVERAFAERPIATNRGGAASAELRHREGGYLLTLDEVHGEYPPLRAAVVSAGLDDEMRPVDLAIYGGRVFEVAGVEATATLADGVWSVRIDAPAVTGTVRYAPRTRRSDVDLRFRDAPLQGVELGHLDLARARATGTLRFRGDRADFDADADLRLREVLVEHPALAGHAVGPLDGTVAGALHVEGGGRRISSAGLTFRRGAAVLHVAGTWDRDGTSDLRADLPRTSCDALFVALSPVLPTLDGLVLRGDIEGHARVSIEDGLLADLKLTHAIDVGCEVVRDAPNADPRRVDGPMLLRLDDGPRWLDPAAPDYRPIGRVPASVVRAFIAAEDARFFDHEGFDPWMIRRALAWNLAAGAFEKGASTITQQLARNLFLDGERTLQRKVEEAVIAWRLEQVLTKGRLLELYLNLIELAPGVRGVGMGAREILARDVDALALEDAARLAALAPAPRRGFDEAWARRYRDLADKLAAGEGLRQLALHPIGALLPTTPAAPGRPVKAARTAKAGRATRPAR